jgi:hypothetical protein
MALTLVDHLMMQKAQCELFPNTASDAERPNPMGVTAHRIGGPRESDLLLEHAANGVTSSSPVSQRVDEE